MSGSHAKRSTHRQQKEFLFLLDNKSKFDAPTLTSQSANCEDKRHSSDLEKEEARILRRRLISELREFGC